MSKEIEALEVIKSQVDGLVNELGDKANSEQVTKVSKEIEALKENLGEWSGQKIEEKMTEINKLNEDLHKQVEELREEQLKLKEQGTGGVSKKDFLKKEDIENFIKTTFKDGRKTGEMASIAFKAPETFGYPQTFVSGAQIDAFTGRFVDPELYQRRRKRNLILDHFNIQSINVPKLIYLEKIEIGAGESPNDGPGGADWIISGAAKPKRSFRVTTGEVEAKKVAIFGTVEDKLLRDVASLENWIREDFMDEMRETYNDGLLNNNPGANADAPLGLKQNAITYDATAAFDEMIPSPSYIDAIVAVAAYQASLKEQTDKVFVSDDVWYAIHILKDNEARYQNNQKIYTNAAGELFIAGIQVVPVDDEDVPSTHILAKAVDPGFKIRNYGPMVFERGLNGEDFREDKTSYRGYQEVLSYIPEHKENTILYDTWANIFTAIAEVEPT